MVEVRKGQGDVKLTREELERRLRERFYDPEFQNVERQIADIVDAAWKTYDDEPYATSHDAFDKDTARQQEVRSAAKALGEAVRLVRARRFPLPQPEADPRPK